METKVMTPSEYIIDLAMHCPVCRSREITAGQAEVTTIEAHVECFCRACEASWFEDFEMVGYSNLQR